MQEPGDVSSKSAETPKRQAGSGEETVFDLIGVGFGPANMALAVLMEEEEEAGGPAPSRLFLDARPKPAWHPNMLIEGSMLQITALKDMAMVRNPQSRFTFLNYLHEKGRLFEFLNLRDLFPARVEFNDYLSWVAEHLASRVRYGRRVTAVRAASSPTTGASGQPVDLLEIEVSTGPGSIPERYLARNVVVATGGIPWWPEGLDLPASGRAFHSSEFLRRREELFPDRGFDGRFVVVGGGQSGAELFYNLATQYPRAQVISALRQFGYKPVDESDFTNSIFYPEMVDFVYDLPKEHRRKVIDSFRDVNYAVVDHPLIRKINRLIYDEKVEGKSRLSMESYLELRRVEERGNGLRIHFRHRLRDSEHTLDADGLVLCTGYRWPTRHPLLEDLFPYFQAAEDSSQSFAIRRDYSLESAPGLGSRVYLQGYCEATHGISETVLSLLPMRAEDIWRSLLPQLEAQRERSTAELASVG
ncbi:MAG: SidA/IucD/PvdA family monooxygenase [Acidobacteriota bacterium]